MTTASSPLRTERAAGHRRGLRSIRLTGLTGWIAILVVSTLMPCQAQQSSEHLAPDARAVLDRVLLVFRAPDLIFQPHALESTLDVTLREGPPQGSTTVYDLDRSGSAWLTAVHYTLGPHDQAEGAAFLQVWIDPFDHCMSKDAALDELGINYDHPTLVISDPSERHEGPADPGNPLPPGASGRALRELAIDSYGRCLWRINITVHARGA